MFRPLHSIGAGPSGRSVEGAFFFFLGTHEH
jgi:hypothetical protein